jgi:membrane protease YdiL (CAAX protease family)
MGKRQLRHDVFAVCATVLLFVVSIQLIGIIVGVIAAAASTASQLASDPAIAGALNDPAAMQSYMSQSDTARRVSEAVNNSAAVASIAGLVIGALWFFLIRGKRLVTTDISTSHGSPRPATFIKLFVVVLGIQFLLMIFAAAMKPLMDTAGLSLTDTLDQAQTSLLADPVGILDAVIIGPAIAELVVRGADLRKLEPHGTNFAIVISALLFGMYHMILYQALFAVFIGLVLGYVASHYSIKWSFALHVCNNLLGYITTVSNSNTLSLAFIALEFICCIITVVMLIKRRGYIKWDMRLGKPAASALRHPGRVALTCVSFWVYAVLTLGTGTVMLVAL